MEDTNHNIKENVYSFHFEGLRCTVSGDPISTHIDRGSRDRWPEVLGRGKGMRWSGS